MNLRKLIAAFLTCAFICAGVPALPSSAEEYVRVTFDLSEPGITAAISPATDEPYDLSGGSYPVGSYYYPGNMVVREGYTLTGWMVDGSQAYPTKKVIPLTESVTLTPIWTKNGAEKHNVIFLNECKGISYTLPDELKGITAAAGEFVRITADVVVSEIEYRQIGWQYGGVLYKHDDYLVMPDADVTFEPQIKYYNNVYYSPGDVDRVLDNRKVTAKCMGGEEDFIQHKELFHRQGFDLTGWVCTEDSEFYAPDQFFLMPETDLHMTAVWSAKTYILTFKNYASWTPETITLIGETDDVITCPEAPVQMTGNLEFSGWKLGDTIYRAGDRIVLDGSHESAEMLEAVWKAVPMPFSMGDVNGDGAADASDASEVLAEYARTSTGKPAEFLPHQQQAGDVNADTAADADDASLILAYYAYASTTKEEVKSMSQWMEK